MHSPILLGSGDEFQTDTLKQCVNSTDLSDLRSKKDTEASQEIPSVSSSPREATLETAAANNDVSNAIWNATETVVAAMATVPDEVHKDPKDQNSSDHVEPFRSEREKRARRTEQKDGVKPNNEWLNIVLKSVDDSIDADFQTEYASGKQNNQLLVNQTGLQHSGTEDVMPIPAESGQLGAWNCGQHWLPEYFQILPADGINNENVRALSRGTFENQIPNDCEEASQQQRLMRRRLQFDAEEACRNNIGNNTNSWNSVNIAPNAMTPAGTMDPEATNSCHGDSYTTSDNKQVINFSPHSSSRFSFYPPETPETHSDEVDTSIRNNRSSCIPSSIGLHLNNIGNAVTVGSISNVQLPRNDYGNSSRENLLSGANFPMLEDSKRWLVPYEKQMPISQDACMLEEYNQMSPKNKRKRDPNAFENEGCKRCNCKKSKCLKLYCDCFAAGVYCAEPCTCLECFNKPEYEDTVLGTRQQIESRNPLAFAPKIVRRATESPQNSGEDNNRKTPGSARHKRGCNCKKSRCLKKYCECYQAGVGCSDGCRCEGCKNVFGKKDEMEHLAAGDERWEDASDGKMENDILQLEQRHSDISPLTPMFQFSNHGRDIHKSQHPIRRHPASSPESEISILSPYGKSPESSHTSDRNCSLNKVSGAGLVFHDQDIDYKIAGKVYPFPPRWDALFDRHDLRPSLQHIQSRVAAAVASDILYSSKDSRHELCQENCSLGRHSSPVTPNVHFSGSNFVIDPNSDDRLYNILEDETPHILKDHSPTEAVKTSSPNKKRVSPPHDYLPEGSSPGFHGHKIILQSVPSFPPLTPFCEPEDSVRSELPS